MNEEWQRFSTRGRPRTSSARAKTDIHAGFIRAGGEGGGFGGKAVTLAEGQVYAGDPGA